MPRWRSDASGRSSSNTRRLLQSGGLASCDPEHRMIRRDPAELIVRGVRPDTVEECPDLELPLLQIGPQHRRLLIVGELDRRKWFCPPTDTQAAPTTRAQVLNPLRVAAWRDQIVGAFVAEQVHRGLSPLAGLAALHLEHARA